MFAKKALILIVIFIHAFTQTEALIKDRLKRDTEYRNKVKTKGKETKAKVIKMTAEQVEFSKKFFKNLLSNQRKAESAESQVKHRSTDGDVPLQASPGTMVRGNPKSVPSGGTVFLDGLSYNYYPIGDPYGGLPDSLTAMAKFCIEFIIKGLLGVIYVTIRYPHKILLKCATITSALILLPHTLMNCLNPLAMANFVQKAKIINKRHDEMAQIQYEWKVRMANIVDRVHVLADVVKLSCCGMSEFKRKCIEAAPDEGKEFLAAYFASTLKLHQTIYCGVYQDGSESCEGVEFPDEEPGRIMPRSWAVLFVEMVVKFF